MNYCKSSQRRLRRFEDFIHNELQDVNARQNIYDEATNTEDEVDVQNDILQLQSKTGLEVIDIYKSALIYSQLYKVYVFRSKTHLYSLSEIAELPRHNNSFVCYHDEGM